MPILKWSFLLAVAFGSGVNAQIPSTPLLRTVKVGVPGVGGGSGFVIETGGRQYVITAHHVVATLGAKGEVDITDRGGTRRLQAEIIHSTTPCVDIAVLSVREPLRIENAPAIPPNPTITLAQEVYFLGFPFGMSTNAGGQADIALIKHALVSGVTRCSVLDRAWPVNEEVFILDGMNNRGFSGGPVIARALDEPGQPLKLIGVITSYRFEVEPLKIGGQAAPNAGIETNTGIIYAVPIDSVYKLLKTTSK